MEKPKLTHIEILAKYDQAYNFKHQIGLYDNVQVNEDFFIGKQWEGVEANGLPTPTFNFLKQVVNFQVANITSDNFVLRASGIPGINTYSQRELDDYCFVLNRQYEAIVERNRIVSKMREFLRNAAVDGDGCMYFYFDPTIENGQDVKGEIVAEVVENTRVCFGNPNSRDVQKQPYIIIAKREIVEDVQYRAEQNKKDGNTDIESPQDIRPDDEKFQNKYDSYTDDKVTVLMYFYKDRKTGNVWCAEATEAGLLRTPYDTGCKLYPIIWLSWDYIHDCYHGQAMITGLIPNQRFVNKMFALVGISLTTSAFPKVVYDKTKIKMWDGSIGSAVGVNGNVDAVAKTIEGAAVNPQIAQFMEICVDYTKSFLGASDVALGDSRPDNTSAIIALQRAAGTPMEMTKQNLYQRVEDMGRIFMDIMAAKYGIRKVEVRLPVDDMGQQPLGMQLSDVTFIKPFNFEIFSKLPITIKQEAGASSYYSELVSVHMLDNLLLNGHINLRQYLERLPNGYIVDQQKLLDEISGRPQVPDARGGGEVELDADSLPVQAGPGNGQLQRALNRQGVA